MTLNQWYSTRKNGLAGAEKARLDAFVDAFNEDHASPDGAPPELSEAEFDAHYAAFPWEAA